MYKVKDYGAWVEMPNGMPLFVHISEMSHTKIRDIHEVVHAGMEMDVQCLGRDTKGLILLSRKALLPKPSAPEKLQKPKPRRFKPEQSKSAAVTDDGSLTGSMAADSYPGNESTVMLSAAADDMPGQQPQQQQQQQQRGVYSSTAPSVPGSQQQSSRSGAVDNKDLYKEQNMEKWMHKADGSG